jgi:hypothetical protein
LRPSRSEMAAVARKRKVRLTVARRRRHCTVFPSTKSAVEVKGLGPLWVAIFGGAKPAYRRTATRLGYSASYVLSNSVTRGRPEDVMSTLSGA